MVFSVPGDLFSIDFPITRDVMFYENHRSNLKGAVYYNRLNAAISRGTRSKSFGVMGDT